MTSTRRTGPGQARPRPYPLAAGGHPGSDRTTAGRGLDSWRES